MIRNRSIWAVLLCTCWIALVSCGQQVVLPTISSPSPRTTNLSPTSLPTLTLEQTQSLESLVKVDDFPLYIMHYYAGYGSIEGTSKIGLNHKGMPNPQNVYRYNGFEWGCSLFATFADPEHALFGRNFDWRYSPALLLYNHAQTGNDSVSMVDIEYLLGDQATLLTELTLEQRIPLLNAPGWPFDGMNDCGLVIGMAAVPTRSEISNDPVKPDIGSLGIMREILDHACTIDEALEIMDAYDILWEGGPQLHYLIAEESGQAALVEYYQGAMKVIPNQDSWHLATNFLLSSTVTAPQGICSRYDIMAEFLTQTSGKISPQLAMHLLLDVSQDSTQWSILYDIRNGEIQLVMGLDYSHPHTFQFEMKE